MHGFEFSTPTTTHVCACAAASVQGDKPNLASSPPVAYQQCIGRKGMRQAVVMTRALASGGESKNILIMGGTRFIGLFLARQLVAAGHQVCCISAMCIPQCPNYLSLHYSGSSCMKLGSYNWASFLFTPTLFSHSGGNCCRWHCLLGAKHQLQNSSQVNRTRNFQCIPQRSVLLPAKQKNVKASSTN
jgi:hypothetical protein